MPNYNEILAEVQQKADRYAMGGRLDPEAMKILENSFFSRIITYSRALGFRQIVLVNGNFQSEGTSRLNYVVIHLLMINHTFREALRRKMAANGGRMARPARIAYELNQVNVILPVASPLTQFVAYAGKAARTSQPGNTPLLAHDVAITGKNKKASPLVPLEVEPLVTQITPQVMARLDSMYSDAILRAFDDGPMVSDSLQEVLEAYGRERKVKAEKAPREDRLRSIAGLFGSAPAEAPAPRAARTLRPCTPEQRAALEIMRDPDGVPEVVEVDPAGNVVGYIEGTAAQKLAAIRDGARRGMSYRYPCGGKDETAPGYQLLLSMAQGGQKISADDF